MMLPKPSTRTAGQEHGGAKAIGSIPPCWWLFSEALLCMHPPAQSSSPTVVKLCCLAGTGRLLPGRWREALPAFLDFWWPNWKVTSRSNFPELISLCCTPAPCHAPLYIHSYHPISPIAPPLLLGRQRVAWPTASPAQALLLHHKQPTEESCHPKQTKISLCWQTGRKVIPPTMIPAENTSYKAHKGPC